MSGEEDERGEGGGRSERKAAGVPCGVQLTGTFQSAVDVVLNTVGDHIKSVLVA